MTRNITVVIREEKNDLDEPCLSKYNCQGNKVEEIANEMLFSKIAILLLGYNAILLNGTSG